MRKLAAGLVVLTLVLFAGAYFGSPILAAKQLKAAAESGDAQALEQLVDFPAFRASLKDELRDRLMREMRGEQAGSGLSGLGMMLAPALVSGAVEVLVTPQAIAAMVQSGQAPDPTERTSDRAASSKDKRDLHQAYGYRDLNSFAVTLTDRDRPDEQMALILRRHGLFGWKLSAIDLDPR